MSATPPKGFVRAKAIFSIWLLVAVAGVYSLFTIPTELGTSAPSRELIVRASLPVASPESIERTVTSRLEAAAQQVRGVRSVSSTSMASGSGATSRVRVELSPDARPDFVRLELAERMSLLRTLLPPQVSGPTIDQIADMSRRSRTRTLVALAFAADTSTKALDSLVSSNVIPALRAVEGVAEVEGPEPWERAADLTLDRERAVGLGLDEAKILAALQSTGVAASAGRIGRRQALTIQLQGRFQSIDALCRMVIASRGGRPIFLCDVATLRPAVRDEGYRFRLDGVPAVQVRVSRSADAPLAETAAAVLATASATTSSLPRGIQWFVLEDNGHEAAVATRKFAIAVGLGIALIAIVTTIGVGTWSAGLVAAVSVSLSMLAGVIVAASAGYSLDEITTLALVMGLGLAADSTAVILSAAVENRRVTSSSGAAAWQAVRDSRLAILGSVVVSIVCLWPIAYASDAIRQSFASFALTIAAAQLAGGLSACTLIPVLVDWVPSCLHPYSAQKAYGVRLERMVSIAATHPLATLVSCSALVIAGTVWAWEMRPAGAELIRKTSARHSIDVHITRPVGRGVGHLDTLIRPFEQLALRSPGIQRTTVLATAGDARLRVVFSSAASQSSGPRQLERSFRDYTATLGGTSIVISGVDGGLGQISGPAQHAITVRGHTYDGVRALGESLGVALSTSPRVARLELNGSSEEFVRGLDEFEFVLDAQTLSSLGVSAGEVVAAMVPSLNSDQTVKLSVENEPLKLGWHRGEFGAAISEDSLLNTVIKLREDRPILLRQVGQLVPRSTMARIDRVQQQYQRVVSFEFDGVSAAADRLIDDAIRSLRVPSGFQVSPRAPWVLKPVSNREIVLVGVGALIAVLIASAVVFESAIQPFIVLLATPLGLIGSASGAYLMGGQFSVEMLIGLILLFGVGASNAMMIVERFNWNRSQNQSLDVEADAVGATTHQFSAIVLTTLLAAAGIMPSLVPALGGSESLRAVGIVLALGLASSALLGILVVPASLVFIARFGSMWSRQRRAGLSQS